MVTKRPTPASFQPGDPRAAAAGRKGGRLRKLRAFSPDYILGYRAGARATRRHFDRWLAAQPSSQRV